MVTWRPSPSTPAPGLSRNDKDESMDIGEPERIIEVKPEPLEVPEPVPAGS
ncbi:MAG TPA: hypothetical protein VLG28_16390 [Acidimicrobiia bacterium]|nr:hypothetical protein [Acidimicrobiia bacterium]